MKERGVISRDWPRRGQQELCAERMTPAEKQILQLSAEGYGYKTIGSLLSDSKRTVEVHTQKLCLKLGASSILEAVVVGFEKGIIDVPKAIEGCDIARVQNLTGRQKQIIALVCDKKAFFEKGIAGKLAITPKTVGSHKYDVSNRLGLDRKKQFRFHQAVVLCLEAKRQGRWEKTSEETPKVLSPEEKDVVVLLGLGLNYQKITSRLGLSEKQMRYLSEGIFQKLQVNSKLGAVITGVKMGLIDPSGIIKALDLSLVDRLTPEEKAKIKTVIDFNGLSQPKLGLVNHYSPRTIETHLRNATKKIGAKNNTQTIILVMERDREDIIRLREEEIGDWSEFSDR